jgi:hypothetical protein
MLAGMDDGLSPQSEAEVRLRSARRQEWVVRIYPTGAERKTGIVHY